MRIVYVAEDGRQFNSQWECEAHEEKQRIASRNLKSRFFGESCKPMDITDLAHCIEEGWYMEIASMEEARFIAEYAEETVGITLFEGKPQVGRFYFNYDDEQWHSIEELYNAYARVLNVFEGED